MTRHGTAQHDNGTARRGMTRQFTKHDMAMRVTCLGPRVEEARLADVRTANNGHLTHTRQHAGGPAGRWAGGRVGGQAGKHVDRKAMRRAAQ